MHKTIFLGLVLFLFSSLDARVLYNPPFGAYWLPEVAKNLPDRYAFFEGCIIPLKSDGKDIMFTYSIAEFGGTLIDTFSFPENQLIKDPRNTKRWVKCLSLKYGTLWEGIEECAGTWRIPAVTKRILNHMIQTGVVKYSNLRKLSEKAISKILRKYMAYASKNILSLNNGSKKEPFFYTGYLLLFSLFIKNSASVQHFLH